MQPKFRILSIDGGGLKGLIAINMLREVENIIGSPAFMLADMFAGTSTGGLIAASLSVTDPGGRPRYDLEHVANLYTEAGMSVMKNGGFSVGGGEPDMLRSMLVRTFGEARLSRAAKPLFIPTYDAADDRIIVFKTRSAKMDPQKDLSLVDVCLATSAIAPVFPPHVIRYGGKRIACEDAGYHLKNPAIAAVAEVFKHRDYYASGGMVESDVALLSVSTGSRRGYGNDWSNDISGVLRSSGSDLRYVRSQKLHIAFEKIRYMRLDLDLGQGGFSLASLFEWGSRINRLGSDDEFRRALMRLYE